MDIIIGGIIPAILFGLTGVLQKASARSGIATSFYLLSVAVGVALTSTILYVTMPERTLGVRSAVLAVLLGTVWALGTGMVAFSIFKYGAPVSKLVPLYNMNTLVAVLLSLIVFSEWKTVDLPRLLVGAALIVGGGILVSRA